MTQSISKLLVLELLNFSTFTFRIDRCPLQLSPTPFLLSVARNVVDPSSSVNTDKWLHTAHCPIPPATVAAQGPHIAVREFPAREKWHLSIVFKGGLCNGMAAKTD
jgi:hypothetical protein